MAQPPITKEQLEMMLKAMDRDGNGKVEKAEFKVPYMKLFPRTKYQEFETLWTNIDKDGSGDLSLEELAQYFGFKLGDLSLTGRSGAEEMTDEQIMEALQMEQALKELAENTKRTSIAKEPAPRTTRRVSTMMSSKQDPDVRTVNSQKKVKMVESDDPEVAFLEMCELGDADGIIVACEKGVCVRIEDEKGEMPLHKIARWGHVNATKAVLTASEKIKKGGRAVDTNYKNKDGKTPMHVAAEFQQIDLVKYYMESDNTNMLAETNSGWTLLHFCVHSNNKTLLNAVLSHSNLQQSDKKKLVNYPDQNSRTPLHIAAYKSSEELVQILMQAGAVADKIDSNGNSCFKLAERSGRRASREVMEDMNRTRRVSKEITDAVKRSSKEITPPA